MVSVTVAVLPKTSVADMTNRLFPSESSFRGIDIGNPTPLRKMESIQIRGNKIIPFTATAEFN